LVLGYASRQAHGTANQWQDDQVERDDQSAFDRVSSVTSGKAIPSVSQPIQLALRLFDRGRILNDDLLLLCDPGRLVAQRFLRCPSKGR
jgi:hypothetical protein